MALISVNQLRKSYGAKILFSGLSFGIEAGQKIGMVGPNGAGKSTLLKTLAKIEEPDEGSIQYSKGLRLAYLSQSPKFEDQTVSQVVLSGSEDPLSDEAQSTSEELLSRLGLNQGNLHRDKKVLTLSGGQQKRVALARELMKQPDVLLLDEPTNHLDIESLMWLEEYLSSQSALALLTVTHDRLFLQNVSDQIYDLDPQYQDGLLKVTGDYATYLETRAIRLEGQQSLEASRANDLRREMQWLQRGCKARTTKAKARIQHTYDLMDEVSKLRSLNHKRAMSIQLETGARTPRQLIEAKGLKKGFGHTTLFDGVDLTLSAKTRIALLGKNGRGKTTLIRVLLGEETLDQGSIKRADNLTVSYFDQTRNTLDQEKSLLQNICAEGDYISHNGRPTFARSYLERFRFRKEQFDLPLKYLSGGEQARLLVAKLMLREATILVLDEPTNDLDIETLDLLRDALVDYEGAVVLVTHDRFFMEQVCDSIIAFPEPEDLKPDEAPGTLFRFESYLQWQNWKAERKKAKQLDSKTQVVSKQNNKGAKLTYKEQREWDQMEENIHAAEKLLEQVQCDLVSDTVISDGPKLVELSNKAAELEQNIASLYERWAELEAKLQTKG